DRAHAGGVLRGHGRGGPGGLGDRGGGDRPGRDRDDGPPGDRGRRGVCPRRVSDRRRRRPAGGARRLGGGVPGAPGRGGRAVPARRRQRGPRGARRGRARADLAGAQVGVRGDGADLGQLLRAGRRDPAHAAGRGAAPHRRAGGRVPAAGGQRLPRRRREPPPARLLRRRRGGRARAVLMAATVPVREAPAGAGDLARRLAEAAGEGLRVRPVGGGTKLAWGMPGEPVDLELSTAGLAEVREHDAGDFVAVVEAGAPLKTLRKRFAASGERLALDPPTLGAATIGGAVATGDSGPLRHRYGAPRDLVVGVTVALSDGTLSRAGGKVIKNVAGYDLGKLLAGSFGTLGAILEVAVRLHPVPRRTMTASGASDDPELLGRAASSLAHAAVEAQCLDV